LIDYSVSTEGIELLGLNVRGFEGLAVSGVSVMVKNHLAIEAVERYVRNVRHGSAGNLSRGAAGEVFTPW
jgi:hypothetical protein